VLFDTSPSYFHPKDSAYPADNLMDEAALLRDGRLSFIPFSEKQGQELSGW